MVIANRKMYGNIPENKTFLEGLAKGIVAYEPIWAIGTGKAATPEHAQIILRFLREHIARYDLEIAKIITIYYGGSVNPENAAKLFSMADIDGGLVGTASLNTQDFVAICDADNVACTYTIAGNEILKPSTEVLAN